MRLKCQRDFRMVDGTLAFRSGHEYEWRWATQEEEAELGEMGPIYAFTSELGEEHFMSYSDVEAAFA